MYHPLPYVHPETFRPTSHVTWSQHFRSSEMSILGHTPSSLWWSHHHWNGWERLRPNISCWGKKMPSRILISGYLRTPRRFQIGGIYLLCHAQAWASTIGWISRRGTANLGWWFDSVKTSQNPVTKIPTNFYVPLLYVMMNLECYIKYGTCSSAKQGGGSDTCFSRTKFIASSSKLVTNATTLVIYLNTLCQYRITIIIEYC